MREIKFRGCFKIGDSWEYGGIRYGDSNIKPDVRNKLRQQLRASIKEMINDYSSASDRAENKYQEGTYEQ